MTLFGTDGIRGRAGEDPILPSTAYLASRTFAEWSKERDILVGMDTRISSQPLASAAVTGLREGGARPVLLGVIPTPLIPFAIRHAGYAGGIMITASHNPWTDNGIKFFGADGRKLADNMEQRIETTLNQRHHVSVPQVSNPVPDTPARDRIADAYLAHLSQVIPGGLPRTWIPLDCANGAPAPFLRHLAERHHLNLTLHHAAPDGRNINEGCGAAQPEHLPCGCAALDGDGDRILFRAEDGTLLNGDHLLMFLADTLAPPAMVGTVMTNAAVAAFCTKRGIAFSRTNVGDRFVRAAMDDCGAPLGGETSGHVIFDPLNPSGDGFAVYTMVLRLLDSRSETLSDVVRRYPLFPQTLLNIPVTEKKPLQDIPGFPDLLNELEAEGANVEGRVFARYSGTEHLLRILVESNSNDWNRKASDRLSAFFHHGGKP